MTALLMVAVRVWFGHTHDLPHLIVSCSRAAPAIFIGVPRRGVPYFCTYNLQVIQCFCMKNWRPVGFIRAHYVQMYVQIAFYTIHSSCLWCTEHIGYMYNTG